MVICKKHERITELGHIESAVWRNRGSLSLQRLTSPRRLGEAVTGTRTALFLLHLSNLRKPRVRKHKVFSKLVNRPLKRSQRSQQPGDKVPSHYHSIDSRDFAYLTGNFTLLFWHGALCILCTQNPSTPCQFCLCFFSPHFAGEMPFPRHAHHMQNMQWN